MPYSIDEAVAESDRLAVLLAKQRNISAQQDEKISALEAEVDLLKELIREQLADNTAREWMRMTLIADMHAALSKEHSE